MNWPVTCTFEENWKSDKRILVNRGGTRSGKTYAICQLLVQWLLTGWISDNKKIQEGWASVVRKTSPSLRATSERDVLEFLKTMGYYSLVDHNKTERIISYKGRNLEFFSVDDQQKVRGRKRNILFCNEGNELSFKKDFYQLLIRTTDKIFIDFNPDDEDVWINTELEQKRTAIKKDVKTIVSNYKWNGFLEPELISEIEYMKEVDPELWEVFGKGNYGKIQGLIFSKIDIIDTFPENKCKYIVYGLDFGFNDPMVLVKVGVNDLDIYIEEMYYKRMQTVGDLITDMPGLGVGKKDIIYCDSATPGSIQDIYNAGFRGAKGAQKGADSIYSGIMKMKKYRLHVCARSQNLLNEIRKYKWAVDKNGDTIPRKPIDAFNHAIDAARYAIYTHTYKPQSKPPRKSKSYHIQKSYRR